MTILDSKTLSEAEYYLAKQAGKLFVSASPLGSHEMLEKWIRSRFAELRLR